MSEAAGRGWPRRCGRLPAPLPLAAAVGWALFTTVAGSAANDPTLAGDGRSDDTAALQRLVDRGGPVTLPRGTFRITRPVTAALDRVGPLSISGGGTATLVMEGPGPALHLIGTHGGTADPSSFKPEVWPHERTPMIDGLEIVGRHPQAVGIRIEGTMQATITRITVREALHGVHLVRRNRNVIISECHLYNNREVGLLLEDLNLHQINVGNCHISYNAGGGIVVRNSEVRNLQIGTCDIEANMSRSPDAPPAANILIDTTSGSVREGAIVGCTLQHTAAGTNSANIRFVGRSAAEPHKAGIFQIGHNVFSDVQANIQLTHARGITITGNHFMGAASHNLLAEDSSNILLGSNLFDRNPDYPPGSRDGLLFSRCADCTLVGLQINGTLADGAGLILRDCRRMNVTGCTILNSANGGVLVENCERVRVSDCIVEDDRPAGGRAAPIRIVGGKGNQIADNLLPDTTPP